MDLLKTTDKGTEFTASEISLNKTNSAFQSILCNTLYPV